MTNESGFDTVPPLANGLSMADKLLPCWGGHRDGEFHPEDKPPLGYKLFPIDKGHIFMWKTIKPEHLDFSTLRDASIITPEEFGKGING